MAWISETPDRWKWLCTWACWDISHNIHGHTPLYSIQEVNVLKIGMPSIGLESPRNWHLWPGRSFSCSSYRIHILCCWWAAMTLDRITSPHKLSVCPSRHRAQVIVACSLSMGDPVLPITTHAVTDRKSCKTSISCLPLRITLRVLRETKWPQQGSCQETLTFMSCLRQDSCMVIHCCTHERQQAGRIGKL